MKVIAIIGSPHGMKGTTSQVANYILEGAQKAGAETVTFSLSDLMVQPCKGCDVCGKTGTCVIDDDYKVIKQTMIEADGIILASPNYVYNVSAQLKAFIDRSQIQIHCKIMKGKYAAAVVTSGGPEPGLSVEYLRFVLSSMLGCWMVDSLFVTNPQLDDEDERIHVHQAAADLGSRLVKAISCKEKFSDQEAELEERFEISKMLVQFHKDRWPFKYEYWKNLWGLEE